jgi:hypothetical protein
MHIPTSTVEYKELLTRLKRFQSETLCAIMMIVIEIFVYQNVYSNRKFHIFYFKAGINREFLTLAYEPEAAAIYCKELTVQKC